MDDEKKRNEYPCDGIAVVARDRSNCPDYGSSDCPLTVEGAVCLMTRDELIETLSYWGK